MLCIFLLNYSISQDDLLQSDKSEIVLLQRPCNTTGSWTISHTVHRENYVYLEAGSVGMGRVTNKKEYMASSNIHWWGLFDSFSVFWLKPKYYLSTVSLPA